MLIMSKLASTVIKNALALFNNNFLHIKCDTSAVFDVTFLPPFAAKRFCRGVRPSALRAALGE